ncbi:FdtA/QdtA family cupin domain-containing protein [Mycobacterium sp. 852002-51163_SCH5372311]|uniref:sugar 3,4-ketoisomerase n=1 Tax=Mycobacterium sp. 852002-51163_SCH5372311 TaxID=1834097 RepID=UPI0009ED91F3|nr:FdtA/QdtA family cupin domain-containing protein [Mycobacterium sp. 852002-51163_SCH5372311]
MNRLDECRILNLERVESSRGNLSPLYGGIHVPFAIKRVYFLYDVPGGAERGAHAHRALQQLIVAASGSFSVTLDDGLRRKTVSLNRSYYGLYLPGLVWREITDFCTGAICLVFASLPYDESDYIHDYEEFLATVRGQAGGSDAVGLHERSFAQQSWPEKEIDLEVDSGRPSQLSCDRSNGSGAKPSPVCGAGSS